MTVQIQQGLKYFALPLVTMLISFGRWLG